MPLRYVLIYANILVITFSMIKMYDVRYHMLSYAIICLTLSVNKLKSGHFITNFKLNDCKFKAIFPPRYPIPNFKLNDCKFKSPHATPPPISS